MSLRREGGGFSSTVLGAGAVLLAALIGAVYPFSADRLHPLAIPALVVAGMVAVRSARDPAFGIAAALVLVALPPDLIGAMTWLPGLVWILLMFGLVVSARPGGGHHSLPPMAMLVLVNLAVVVFAYIRSPEASQALSLLRSTVTGALLFFVVATQVRRRRDAEVVATGFLAGGTVIAALACWQWLTGTGFKEGFITSTGEIVYRVAGGLGHPNQLGGFLVLVVPVGLAGLVLHRKGRAMRGIALTLSVVAIYASFSRGSLIALALVPLFLVPFRLVLVALPCLAIAVVTLAPHTLEERFGSGTTSGSVLDTRTDIFRTAIALWEEEPLLGHGLGSFPDAYAQSKVPGREFLPGTHFTPPPHAHNVYLHLLAEQGLVGAFVFLGTVLRAAVLLRRQQHARERWRRWYSRGVLAAFAAFAVHNLLDVTLFEQTGVYIWGLLGFASALTSCDQERPETVAPEPIAGAAR